MTRKCASKDKELRRTFEEGPGDHVFLSFIQNKKDELDLYRTGVTDYELKRYLPVLWGRLIRNDGWIEDMFDKFQHGGSTRGRSGGR
jgi:hypothetical protein